MESAVADVKSGGGRRLPEATRARAASLADTARDTNGVLLVTATTDGDADVARALAIAVRDLLPAGRPGSWPSAPGPPARRFSRSP